MKINKKSLIVAAVMSVAALSLLIPQSSRADEHGDDRGRKEERYERHGDRGKERDERREDGKRDRDKAAAPFPESALYKQECSSCHFLYHPGLLPLRSWEEIIKNSDRHFGENLSLEDKTRDGLLTYFYEHSAEKTGAEWAGKILASAGASAPARITEVPYINRKHRKIKKEVFKRPSINSFSNCGACHTKGAEGDFEEDRVRIPAK